MAAPSSLENLSAEDAAIRIAEELTALRAENVEVLDVQKILPITSCFVLATGSSSRAIKNLADAAERMLRSSKFDKIGVESDEEGRWICVDYTEVVVHVFDDNARRFYDMDQLWADAARIPFSGAPEAPSQVDVPADTDATTEIADRGTASDAGTTKADESSD